MVFHQSFGAQQEQYVWEEGRSLRLPIIERAGMQVGIESIFYEWERVIGIPSLLFLQSSLPMRSE